MIAINQNVIDKMNEFKRGDRDFPISELIEAYHLVGKHFVSPELLNSLNDCRTYIIKNNLKFNNVYLIRILNNLLDKFDSKFDYRSYISLDLLDLSPLNKELIEYNTKELDRRIVILGYDIMRFEIASFEGKENWLPNMKAEEELVQNRCKKVLNVIGSKLKRLDIINQWDEDKSIANATKICRLINEQITDKEKFVLLISNLPVYTIHDEYLFIRVLQSFETIFTWVVNEQKIALLNFEKNIQNTINSINLCCNYFSEVYSLFTLLSTLRPDAFKIFRTYTEGASAIQSRAYKEIEALCRLPDIERLDSIAYFSVPEVRDLIKEKHFSLDDMNIFVQNSTEYTTQSKENLINALRNLQSLIHRWKMMHYGLAVRMLGKKSNQGTGYTAGTPYLKDATNIPVFKSF
jgi:tryptophan 2,3-dioxygenase